MVTIETIKAIPALADLQENQVTEILSLVKARVKEQNDRYDADIFKITGKEKPGGQHSYQHLEKVLNDYVNTEKEYQSLKVQSETFSTQIEQLKTEKGELESKLKEGGKGDAATKLLEQKLVDKESEITNLKTTFETEKTTLQESLQAEKQKNIGLQFGQSIDGYLMEKKVKYLQTIPETIREKMLKDARTEVLTQNKLDVLEDGKQVFRDTNGDIVWNKETGQHMTPGEMYLSKISDLVDKGQKQEGAGTKPGKNGGVTGSLDLSSAKTKVEATKMIDEYLMVSEGLSKTDPKFSDRQVELYQGANLGDLPIK